MVIIIAYVILNILGIFYKIQYQKAYQKGLQATTDFAPTGREMAQKLLPYLMMEQTISVLSSEEKGRSFYDKEEQKLYLSPKVWEGNTVSHFSVVVYEIGKMIQIQEKNNQLKIRQLILRCGKPIQFLAYILIFCGFIMGFETLSNDTEGMIALNGVFYFGMILDVFYKGIWFLSLFVERYAWESGFDILIEKKVITQEKQNEMREILKYMPFRDLR